MSRSPRDTSMPIDEYVARIRARIDDAKLRGHRTLRYSDLVPAPLAGGLYASFDGIEASGHARTRTYPWSRPSSSFLEAALSNFGSVPDPHALFSIATRVGSRAQRFGAFQHAFNDLMRDTCRIVPYPAHHRNGRVLVKSALERGMLIDDPACRVYVDAPSARAIAELRSLHAEWLDHPWR